MSSHVGIGPEGGNLLGFLASVGTLATLARAWPDRDVRMSWTQHSGWRPVWHMEGSSTDDDIVAVLARTLKGRGVMPEFSLGNDLGVAPEAFAAHAREAARAATPANRRWADFVAAFGCEGAVGAGVIQDTALRTMSGAGHQHFLGFARELARVTAAEHLRTTLFAPWTYTDDRPSMRWGPLDDRQYALRADDPSKAPIRTVRGANRLALEALPYFPTAVQGRRLETTGFSREGRDWVMNWPIWAPALRLNTVRALLTHPALIEAEPKRAMLEPLGVVEVFRCRRVTVDRYRNFAPAEPCFAGTPVPAKYSLVPGGPGGSADL